MAATLSQFAVYGLHGHANYDIRIDDNRLILVGENGSGKTTMVTLLFRILSGQWEDLEHFEFEAIELTLNGNNIIVKKSDLRKLTEQPTIPSRFLERIERALSRFGELRGGFTGERLALRAGVPRIYAERFIRAKATSPEKEDNVRSVLRTLRRKVLTELGGQVLFLPTYRRIETDLTKIFPEADVEELMSHRRRIASPGEGFHFLEMVEFGMSDVEKQLNELLGHMKEDIRSRLYSLAITYLGEIVEGGYEEVDVGALKNLDPQQVGSIIDHTDEAILPAKRKNKLRDIVHRIAQQGIHDDRDKVLAHFFLRLLAVHNHQQELEAPIRDFIEICNKYLVNKSVIYDSNAFELKVIDRDKSRAERKIPLNSLSSGEKQIVSLFSHLIFSRHTPFYVLIDEPELSLSLTWQKQFLQDIASNNACGALIAVTHSPFVFENSLDRFAHDISEFRRG